MAEKKQIEVKVNGTSYKREVEPRLLLGDFLREDLGLTGTHFGCEHGVCGACTVMLNGTSVRSCLMFAIQANGAEIMTVEGIADGDKMHPLQQSFWDNHGLQCGFCTSGMLITALDLIKNFPLANDDEIRLGLSGNLCRCTGYQNIITSVREAAKQMRAKKAA
ncbi:MAG: (2Fe-2S)-binding protein [Candidatus Binatus sp.]|uniref:(2Fe-2S)-binding protein n=1 Tax=Candidatus Binatus sp. TaxID=2811406 RepID=UPI003BAFB945